MTAGSLAVIDPEEPAIIDRRYSWGFYSTFARNSPCFVAQFGGPLKLEFFGGGTHFGLEFRNDFREFFRIFGSDVSDFCLGYFHVIRLGNRDQRHVDRLDDAFGSDIVFEIVPRLDIAAPIRFVDRALHGVRHPVRVKNRAAIDVPGSAAHRLNERIAGPQEAFLIRVENRHKRDLGQIETFTKQINADKDIEFSPAEAPENLDTFQRLDLGVQIPAAGLRLRCSTRPGPRPFAW